jgi:8-oxo-dGTP pyrophosphatase MutT (NUDIX family)
MLPDAIADAASIVLLRGRGDDRQVLMGQRAPSAVFMPAKFVFPGGRVDKADHIAPAPQVLAPACRAALHAHAADDGLANSLVVAGLRELWEETGLHLANPRAAALRFVFRAITPPGRPRRFDARFFLANAADFGGDSAGFSGASGELSFLQWLPLPAARSLDLPFITRVILAEIEAGPAGSHEQAGLGVPFFDNSGPLPVFSRL